MCRRRSPRSFPPRIRKKLANDNARLIYSEASKFYEELVRQGKTGEIKTGLTNTAAAVLAEGDPEEERYFREDTLAGGSAAYYAAEIPRELAEIFRSHSEFKGGEFCYYIDPDSFKLKWAQWRADKLGKIGQYPAPQEGLKFGKAPQEKTQNIGELTATVKGFAYTSFGDNSSWVSSDSVVDRLVYDTLKEKLALREKIAPDESKPQISGPAYEVKLADVTLVTSDRSDAPLIVNGEYCRCEYAENLFAELTSPMRSIDSFSVLSNEGGECDADLGDHSEELCRWYEEFLSQKQEPLTDVGSVVHTPETKYAKYMFNDTQVIVANTKYSKANVQINGQFYRLDDPVPLGIIDKAYAEKQSME